MKKRHIFVCIFCVSALSPALTRAETSVTCLIEPRALIDLSAPVAGVLVDLPVERGDRIAAGDTLAQLDTRLDDMRVEMAERRAETPFTVAAREARHAFLQQRAERLDDLSARAIVPRAEYEEAASEAEAALQELEAAKFDRVLAGIEAREAAAIRAQKILLSPTDGVIHERRASVGEYQDGTDPILTIARLDPLRVEAFAPIDLYTKIAIGDRVVVEPEAPIGGRYDATIAVIDKVFDAGTGTVGIRVDLPNPDNALPAGLRCRLIFPDD